MFNVWVGDVEITRYIFAISVVALLPVQIFLCFKAKGRVIRIVPVIILSVLTFIYYFMGVISSGWDTLGYMLIASFTGSVLFLCGISWVFGQSSNISRKKRVIVNSDGNLEFI